MPTYSGRASVRDVTQSSPEEPAPLSPTHSSAHPGAHTPSSLLSAAQWFAQVSAAKPPAAAQASAEEGDDDAKAAGAKLRVLIFNSTGGRCDSTLLTPLVDPARWMGAGQVSEPQGERGAGARLFDVVLFVPNDSTLNALPGRALARVGALAPRWV
jgi:hypothetical protein